jgi:hypothetical protein
MLENFKNEFCATNFSNILYEDKFLRIVDTTIIEKNELELILDINNKIDYNYFDFNVENNCYYDIIQLKNDLGIFDDNDNDDSSDDNRKHNDANNINDNNRIDNNNNDDDNGFNHLVTIRRFEFINSSMMAQTEMIIKNQGDCLLFPLFMPILRRSLCLRRTKKNVGHVEGKFIPHCKFNLSEYIYIYMYGNYLCIFV